MVDHRRRRLTALLLPLFAACTAKGQRYAPAALATAAGTGIIFVYRPLGTITTRGESPFISINGELHGRLRSGAYMAVTAPEGEVKVSVQQSLFMLVPTILRSVMVSVAAGSRSYVRVDQVISSADLSGGVTVNQSVMIEEVSAEVGQEELAKARKNL